MSIQEQIKYAPEISLRESYLLALNINIQAIPKPIHLRIQRIIIDHFNITNKQLKSRSRKRDFVVPRQISSYFTKMFTKFTLAEIGEMHGGFDHATALSSCKNINNLIDTDKEFRKLITILETKIKTL